MIKKEITQAGNPIIRRKSKEVKNVQSSRVGRVIRNLIDSMRFHGLVGMAAPQIGENVRVFVSEIRKTKTRKNTKDSDPLRVYINPHIVSSSKNLVSIYEGCGSVGFAKIFGPVKRPKKVIIEASNERGVRFVLEAKGLLARVIQHEMDHLDGLLFIDKVDDMKKVISANEYIKRFAKT